MPDGSGGKFIQKDDGFGDLRLALPLKRYFNLDGKSGSWTIKPMLRIPLSDKDEYDFYYKEFGAGLGAGYEAETADFFLESAREVGSLTGIGPPNSIQPLTLDTTTRPKKPMDPSFGKPIFITKTMNQRLCLPDRLFTLTTTIPFIRESSGSSTSSITKVFLTMETGMCSRSESVGFSKSFVKKFTVVTFGCSRVFV